MFAIGFIASQVEPVHIISFYFFFVSTLIITVLNTSVSQLVFSYKVECIV